MIRSSMHLQLLIHTTVGETRRYETAVSVVQLNPGAFYDLRVFTVSAAGFQTPSRLVHFRTLGCPHKQEQNVPNDHVPTIRVKPLRAAPLPSPSAPAMSRELSGGPAQGRRTTIGRKHSPGNIGTDISASLVEDPSKFGTGDEGDDSLAQLSQRFQKIQQDNEAAEAQIAEEEKEFENSLKELEARRDELKQSLKERDEASNDLKKQVHKMESANRSAQNERSKKEKLLQQKEEQRRKRKEDILRWKEQTVNIEEELARMEREKEAVEEDRIKRIEELKEKMAEEQKEVKLLDESIKEKGTQVKVLEEERKHLHAEDENDESREADRLELERDRQWQEKLHNLNATYMTLCNALALAKSQFEAARERLAWCENARRTNPAFAPVAPLDLNLSRKGSKQSRSRHGSSLTNSLTSPNPPTSGVEAIFGGIGFSQHPINPSPTLSSGSAFFNMSNGTALGGMTGPEMPGVEDMDIPMGGAPMSPRADALLPANLLGDEESLTGEDDEASSQGSPNKNSNRLSSLGPSVLSPDQPGPGTPSPSTSSGPSDSFFQSPRESLQNVNDQHDPEQASISSLQKSPIPPSTSEKGLSTSQKLTGLFTFNRQRGKTSSDEPPMLGSLKPGQSQSFPRDVGDPSDPLGVQRRRRLSQGNWANGMTHLFPRHSMGETKDIGFDRSTSTRRMLPGLFSSSRLNPTNIGRASGVSYDTFGARDAPDSSMFSAMRNGSASPRPSSTYSFDRLPRPSTENQPFGWGPPDRAKFGASPLAPDWSTALSWSRSQSRRPSFQYGSTSNLSLGTPQEDVEYVDPLRESARPLQAPIGTRPPSSQRPSTPKLNPAAPSFRTLFTKKTEKEKDKGKSKDVDGSSDIFATTSKEASLEETSPLEPRKSKDGHSIVTAGSMASTSVGDLSRDSLDRSVSGTPSETTPSNLTTAAARESFIQKITRKSSSTKFNSWKDKSGSFFSSSRGKAGSDISTPTSTTTALNNIDDDLEDRAETPLTQQPPSLLLTPSA